MSAHGMSEAGGLREAVEALADEAQARKAAYPSHPHWSAWDHYESDLRDALAAHPAAPEADPTAGECPSNTVCWGTCDRHTPFPRPATPDAGDALRDPRTAVGAAYFRRNRESDAGDASTADVLRDWDAGDEDSAASHGDASTSASEPLSENERESLRAVMGDVAGHPFVTVANEVERIVAAREAKARAEAGERALLDAAEDARDYLTTPNVSLRDWLRERADRIAREVTS